MRHHILRTTLFSTLAIGLTAAGRAATYQTFSGDMSDAQVVNFVSNGHAEGAYSGRYKTQVGSAPNQGDLRYIFCVDANHDVFFGQSYQINNSQLLTAPVSGLNGASYSGGLASALKGDYGVSVSDAEAARRASEVAYLADTYLGGSNSVNNFTGVSMSIWDIVQDGGDGFTTGGFQLQDPNGSAHLINLANGFEAEAAQHGSYVSRTAYWVQASRDGRGGHGQDFVMLGSPAPTPEPASGGVLLLGASGLGALAARRARRSGS